MSRGTDKRASVSGEKEEKSDSVVSKIYRGRCMDWEFTTSFGRKDS